MLYLSVKANFIEGRKLEYPEKNPQGHREINKPQLTSESWDLIPHYIGGRHRHLPSMIHSTKRVDCFKNLKTHLFKKTYSFILDQFIILTKTAF